MMKNTAPVISNMTSVCAHPSSPARRTRVHRCAREFLSLSALVSDGQDPLPSDGEAAVLSLVCCC